MTMNPTVATHAATTPRQGWRRSVALLLSVLTLMALAGAPAHAKPPGGGGGGGGGGSAGPQACTDLDPADTTTLDEVRAAIGVPASGLTGAGVGVAVVDTGVNAVSGLAGQVSEGVDVSFDSTEDNLRHHDLHGHGTAMASIVAASDSFSGDGIAPGAHIVDVKAGAGDGTVDVSQVIAAIDWVVQHRDQHNIRVLSLAYNTDGFQNYRLDPLSHAVESAWRNGIVVVVAGGNDGRNEGRLGNPASNPSVISVGASREVITRNGSYWDVPNWSSTGDDVRNPDLVAPGEAILSAGVSGSYLVTAHSGATCTDGTDMYLRGSGTSQSSAVVAGAVALLLEQRPHLTPDQVKFLLTSNTVTMTDHRGNPKPTRQQGGGMIDLAAALAAPTPSALAATQTHAPSTGLGSLHQARGTMIVANENGEQLSGELTAFSTTWNPAVWAPASSAGTAWNDVSFDTDGLMSAGTWMGATWSGSQWSGGQWSGATWSGATWSGATWSGATWSGATWSGATWSGATWSGSGWAGASWTGGSWTAACWLGAACT